MKEMSRKIKLANWILLETEELKNAVTVKSILFLAAEITKDANELARLVSEEEKEAA